MRTRTSSTHLSPTRCVRRSSSTPCQSSWPELYRTLATGSSPFIVASCTHSSRRGCAPARRTRRALESWATSWGSSTLMGTRQSTRPWSAWRKAGPCASPSSTGTATSAPSTTALPPPGTASWVTPGSAHHMARCASLTSTKSLRTPPPTSRSEWSAPTARSSMHRSCTTPVITRRCGFAPPTPMSSPAPRTTRSSWPAQATTASCTSSGGCSMNSSSVTSSPSRVKTASRMRSGQRRGLTTTKRSESSPVASSPRARRGVPASRV